ncbi:MAG: response regulator [Proteocatella sp.]
MYKAILVDDEILVREAIGEKIKWELLGLELVANCRNGKEAKAYIESNPVDIVMTDICMPYMDGMELSKFIFESGKDIKIVIFSGFDEFQYAQKALKYKVEEYLLKPITSVELSEVLGRIKIKIDEQRERENKIDKVQRMYFKNKLAIRNKVLYSLMLGTKTETEHKLDLAELSIELKASNYRVAAIEINSYSNLSESDEKSKQERDLMFFSVLNILEELAGAYDAGQAFQGNNNMLYMIFKTSNPRELNQIMKELCLQTISEVKRLLKLDITIGAGGYVDSLKVLCKSYEEAQQALEYQYILGKNILIDIEEIHSNCKTKIKMESYLEELTIKMKMNDKEEIKRWVQEMANYFSDLYIPKKLIMIYLQQTIVAVNVMARASELSEHLEFISEDVFMNSISEEDTMSDSVEKLQNYCLKVAEIIENEREGSGKKIALMALDYIEKNYDDNEINLNSVCRYLCISPSHFSKLFKACTGDTFVETLTKKRMDRAKELLANTNLKNYEIASKVGFSDPHYFSISFKKATGKTPKEYAKDGR